MIKRFGSYVTAGVRSVPFLRLGALGTAMILCAALTLQAATQSQIAHAAEIAQSSGMLNAVTPQRILDTRTATGGHDGTLAGSATMQLSVLGNGGVPAAGVSAVLINVTAVNETASSGYLTLFQTGTARPASSTLNYVANTAIANEAMVRVGSNGTISIYNSVGQTNVIVDVEGWVGIDGSVGDGTVTTGVPSRVLDTRTATGGHEASLVAGQHISVPIAGVGNIPSSGVSSVLADIVAVPNATAGGYLTAYSSSATSVPRSSSVNFAPGTTTSTLDWVPVGSDGRVNLYSSTSNVNAVIDIFGWVSGGAVTTDAGVQVSAPARILDTRTTTGNQQGALSANETLNLPVLGVGGTPSSGVAAVIAHVAAVNPAVGTYLNVFPSGYPQSGELPPGDTQMISSALNVNANTIASNTVIVPVGANGDISIHNYTSNPNVVVDIEGWIAAPVLNVTAPLASTLSTGGALATSDGQRAQAILANANLYAMTTWWNTVAPQLLAAPMTNATAFQPNGTAATDVIRRLSSEAYSLAAAISTGAYDPATTGVPTATATARVAQIINTVAAGHLVNTPGGWGANWQSMFWASYLGTAAWMIWPQLTSQVQAEVAKVVYFEANWGAGYPLIYYANEAGTVVSAGNTGADNNSWQSMAAQLAAAMMPTNAMVPVWQNTVVRDALAAWARPSDTTSNAVENGASVASWVGGSNVLSTGDLYNHGRIAPDYSSLIYQNMQDILVDALAGQSTPQAITALVAPVYAAYTSVSYTDPPYDTPGGTVYTPGSASIYYPQGCDWGTGQEIPYALADAESAAFGVGTTTSAAFEDLHANAALALQQSHTDGHSYDTNAQFNYTGREENVAQEAAQLYFTKYVRDHSLASFNNTSEWLTP